MYYSRKNVIFYRRGLVAVSDVSRERMLGKCNAHRSDVSVSQNARLCPRRETDAKSNTNANEKRREFKSTKKITNAIEHRRSNSRQIFFPPRTWCETIDKGCAARDSAPDNAKRKSDCLGAAADARGIAAPRESWEMYMILPVRYIIENLAQIAIEKCRRPLTFPRRAIDVIFMRP